VISLSWRFFDGAHSAELFVVDQARDRGVIAIERVVASSFDIEGLAFEIQGIENIEPARERFAYARDHFDHFQGLQASDDASSTPNTPPSAQLGIIRDYDVIGRDNSTYFSSTMHGKLASETCLLFSVETVSVSTTVMRKIPAPTYRDLYPHPHPGLCPVAPKAAY